MFSQYFTPCVSHFFQPPNQPIRGSLTNHPYLIEYNYVSDAINNLRSYKCGNGKMLVCIFMNNEKKFGFWTLMLLNNNFLINYISFRSVLEQHEIWALWLSYTQQLKENSKSLERFLENELKLVFSYIPIRWTLYGPLPL